MKNLLKYILVLLIISSCQTKIKEEIKLADDPIKSWHEFESKNKAFIVEFPLSEVRRKEDFYFDEDNIKRKSTMMSINLQDSLNKLNFAYSASYSNFKELQTGEFGIDEFYNWQKEHFIEVTGNNPVYDKEIKIGKLTGREMQFKLINTHTSVRYRLVIKDSTYYLLQVLTSMDDKHPINLASKKFFESFKFKSKP